MEQKYCIGTNSGQIMWDIQRILNDLSSLNSPIEMSIDDVIKISNFHGNPEYAMTTDLTKPLIIAELITGKAVLIDGNHRLFKAEKLGIKKMKCYYLLPSQHKKYIVDFYKSIYDKVVLEF